MNETFIKVLRSPESKSSILIAGFPGVGEIGSLAAKMLTNSFQADLFAELYSPTFQDLVFIDKRGICYLPKFEFYYAKKRPDLILLRGNGYPELDDIPGHYEVSGAILDFVEDLGCRFIITIDGVVVPLPQEEIYVAATSKEIASHYVKRGAHLYRNRRIIGLSGLLVGLAAKRGLDGICLLASTPGYKVDRQAALRVYRFLIDALVGSQ
ncbi:MAG: hypothetical protein AYL33_005450 [Candidatus Bathyarchaeota archaeon B63]|nr:MAG: hypothetical protein AYL33_005450 [Candidatus Bathyarchaeota archaeon B63]